MRPLTAPAFAAQYAYRCTTAGSASAEPAWPLTNNSTVTATGGAVFTCVAGQSAYGWSAAAGNLYAMTQNTTRFTIGDRCFLSSDHSESSANSYSNLSNVSGYGLVQFISANRAGSVPPAVTDALSGATILYNGGGAWIIDNTINTYWQGVTLNLGGSGSSVTFGNSGNKGYYFRNCAFVFSTSNTGATFAGTNNPVGIVILDNTTIQFNNAGQSIRPSNYWLDYRWINTAPAVLGTAPTTLFSGNPIGVPFTCRGLDLNALTGTLFAASGNSAKVLLDSCRIAPGLTRYGGNPTSTADEVELVNCFDGTNILSERHTPAGDLTTNRSTTLVGGAQDDVGLFAHQMVSSTRADMLAMTLDSFWMDVENTYTGSARTATVEIVSSSALNNTDISLVLEYQGTSGSSLATLSSTLPSALTAVAAVPTSTAVWNSPPSTPVYQHLQASFTPQTAGRVRGVVRLGKPSTTVYVNPQIIVT